MPLLLPPLQPLPARLTASPPTQPQSNRAQGWWGQCRWARTPSPPELSLPEVPTSLSLQPAATRLTSHATWGEARRPHRRRPPWVTRGKVG